MVSMNGQMGEFIRAIGKKIKCMGKGKLNGQMGDHLLEYCIQQIIDVCKRFETW